MRALSTDVVFSRRTPPTSPINEAYIQRIGEEALRLFLERGYDETTLDAIADAADVARRTLFHYFDSKEAILQAMDSDMEDVFRAELNASSHQRPLEAVREALLALISRYESAEAMALDRLMRSTPALRARKQANFERQEQALYLALGEKWSDPAQLDGLRAVAMLGIGAIRMATERWGEQADGLPLGMHLERAFAQIRFQSR